MNKTLLYFSAAWCGPCKMFGPLMDEIAQELSVTKYDVDVDALETTSFGIRNVPTVVLVDETGAELGRFAGVKSKQQVIDFYNQQI